MINVNNEERFPELFWSVTNNDFLSLTEKDEIVDRLNRINPSCLVDRHFKYVVKNIKREDGDVEYWTMVCDKMRGLCDIQHLEAIKRWNLDEIEKLMYENAEIEKRIDRIRGSR